MKKKNLATLVVTVLILDAILTGITVYYYSMERWATGTIYLFIVVTMSFFSFIWVQERKDRSRNMGNEVEVVSSDIDVNSFINISTGGVNEEYNSEGNLH